MLAAFVFIAVATLQWNEWTGNAVIQTTTDAYVRADLTRLSSRVAGEVLNVAVQDFQRVKSGDLLIQICSDTPDTNIHALRDIVRNTPDLLMMR